MEKKFLFATIIIVIVLAFVIYFAIPKEVIPTEDDNQSSLSPSDIIWIESESEIIPSNIDPNAISGKSYYVSYTNDEIIEKYGEINFTCYVQKIIFKDSASAEDFFEQYIIALDNYTANREILTIKEFEGYSFIALQIDSKDEVGTALAVRKGNNIIYALGAGFDKDTLIKVNEWFIDQE